MDPMDPMAANKGSAFMDLPPELRAAIVNHDELNNTDQVVMALTCKENNEVMQLKRISIHIPQHDHMYGCPVHMRGGVDFIVNCVVIMVSALKCATARGAPCEHLDGVGVANSGCVKKCDRGIPFDAFKALAMSSQANLLETVSYICMNNHEVAMNAEQIQFVIDHLPSLRCLDIPGGVQVEVSRDKAASPVLWDPRVQFDHVNLDINSQLIEQLPALPATVKGLKFSYFEPWRRYNSNPVAKLTATGLLSGIHSLTFNWQDENSMVSIIGAIPSVFDSARELRTLVLDYYDTRLADVLNILERPGVLPSLRQLTFTPPPLTFRCNNKTHNMFGEAHNALQSEIIARIQQIAAQRNITIIMIEKY